MASSWSGMVPLLMEALAVSSSPIVELCEIVREGSVHCALLLCKLAPSLVTLQLSVDNVHQLREV